VTGAVETDIETEGNRGKGKDEDNDKARRETHRFSPQDSFNGTLYRDGLLGSRIYQSLSGIMA